MKYFVAIKDNNVDLHLLTWKLSTFEYFIYMKGYLQ